MQKPISSSDAADRQFRIGLPWKMAHYRRLNGWHPLVASFIEGNAALHPVILERAQPSGIRSHVRASLQIRRRATQLGLMKTARFYQWLNVTDQLAIEAQARDVDALFLHTTPLYFGSIPWNFHFESLPSVFMPFMFHGKTMGIDLKTTSFFRLVRERLESPKCQRIFSHMRESLTIMDQVFESEIISKKLNHVPLGITTPPPKKSLEKYDQRGPLRILFTNSMHQIPSSFYLRGGHHLIDAFIRLRQKLPGTELTVLSSIPEDLKQRFSSQDLKGVNWIDRFVDDAALEKLLLDHHFFALPAAGLHSYSFLRAISHGCVPIVSDAPGYSELMNGFEESVLVVRGIRDLVYRREPAGWLSDCYAPFIARSEYFAQQIYDSVITHPEMDDLRQLAARNIEHCRQNFNLEKSHAEFNRKILQEHIP